MENLSGFYYSICGAEASTEFYYKEEQRQSGSFQKKWDQGFFFPLKMSSLLLFFQTGDRTACFYKAGNDLRDITRVMMPQEREGLLLE